MKKLLIALVVMAGLCFYTNVFAELQVVDGPITAQSITVTGQVTIQGGSPGAGKVLTSNAAGLASWQTPTGSGGDVVGPASSTDNNFAFFSGTTGKLLKNRTSPLSDSNGNLIIDSGWRDKIRLKNTDGSTPHTILLENSVGLRIYDTVAGALMQLNPNGNVGIGTTNPLGKLQIGANNYETNLLMLGPRDSTYLKAGRLGVIYPYVIDSRLVADSSGWGFGWTHENVNDSAKYTMMYLGPDGQYGANYRLWLDGYIALGNIDKSYADISGGFPTMATTIKLDPAGNSFINSGNVGIGTTSPSEKLTSVAANNESFLGLSGASNSHTSIALGRTAGEARLAIASASGLYSTSAATGDAVLRVDGSSQKLHLQAGVGAAPLTVTSANVGVGTTSPTEKLHVAGDVKVDGALFITKFYSNNCSSSWVCSVTLDPGYIPLYVRGRSLTGNGAAWGGSYSESGGTKIYDSSLGLVKCNGDPATGVTCVNVVGSVPGGPSWVQVWGMNMGAAGGMAAMSPPPEQVLPVAANVTASIAPATAGAQPVIINSEQ